MQIVACLILLGCGAVRGQALTAARIGLVSTETGLLVARCHQCVAGASKLDQVFIHIPAEQLSSAPFAQWDLEYLSNGKVALRSADTGRYISRCRNCGPSEFVDSATVHVGASDLSTSPWAQFVLEYIWDAPFGSEVVAFRADTGNYLARCVDCWEDVIATDPNAQEHLFVNGLPVPAPESSSSSDAMKESSSGFGPMIAPPSARFHIIRVDTR
jgi:hypothetical protein